MPLEQKREGRQGGSVGWEWICWESWEAVMSATPQPRANGELVPSREEFSVLAQL